MDHELQCVLRNPSVEAIQHFQSRMTGSWTVGMAETLLSTLRTRPSSLLLYLLATSEWDDHVVYALQPLKFLTGIVVEQEEPLAMVAAARMWESLERMRSCSSPFSIDTLWLFSHVEPSHLHQMANIAVKLITCPHGMILGSDGVPLIDPDVVCEACVSFLSLLLKYDVMDWIHDLESEISTLAKRLEHESSRLHESHLSSTTSVRLSLSSVALISLLQWKLDDFNVQTHSASLVDYVCKISFPSNSNSQTNGPQWAYEPMATDLRSCALNLLEIWCLTGEQPLPDRCWSNFLLDSWAAVMESRGGGSIPSLLFLHTACRLPARQALHFVLARKDLKESCRALVASLMNHFQQKDIGIAASSVSLLRILLSDRLNTITHDELSRSLWSSLDVFPVDKLLDGIIKLASSDSTSRRACQPLIVGMMEVLELLVSYPEGSRSSLLETDTDRVESLIEIMSLRDGINVDMSLSMEEMNEETPPANNLSRLDESQISLAPAQAPEKQGLNDTIRIAAACVLVRMACGEASEGTETLWQTRIRTAVMDFTSTFRLYGHPQACADMRRRVFHLQAILATLCAENENLISSSLAAEDLLCRREQHDHAQQMLDYQRDLDEARSHVMQLTAERDGYKKAMRLQAAAFKKSLQWTKSKATAEASQLVNVHVCERSAAEKRANECLRRTKHLEELQQENERRIDEYRSLEAHSRQELSETVAKLKDTHQELQHQRTLVDDHERRSADRTEELSSLTSRLQSVEGEHKASRGQLTASQAALEKTKDAYHKLHDDLEKTFAQLSFLAQAYQSQEDQITAIVEKKDQAVQEARRKADMERRRNDELEANERQLQFENDRLTKKLTKAKEKLEEERNQRHEESQRTKRHAPVAYINQLHTSTTSEASRRAQLSGKPSREERKRLLGKENRSYAFPSKRDYR